MNIFDNKEQEASPVMAQATQEVEIKAYADKKVKGILSVFDTIDKKIFSLSNPKKGEEVYDAQKQIDSLTERRNNLVGALTASPEVLTTIKKSSFNNGDVFMKVLDPRAYALMSPEQQQQVQKEASALTQYGTVVPQREAGMITGAIERPKVQAPLQ